MDELVQQFLQNRFWKNIVKALGPTFTCRILFSLKFLSIGKKLSRTRTSTNIVQMMLGFPPDAVLGDLQVFHEKDFYKILVSHYDREMAPQKGQNLNLLLVIFKKIGIILRVKFVWNVGVGVGHNTPELDYFFRLKSLDKKNFRYIFIRRHSSIHNDSIELYRSKFWFASNNSILFDFLYPLVISDKSLRIDCGLSRGKWNFKDDGSYDKPAYGQTNLFEISKLDNITQHKEYYIVRSKTKNEYPLMDGIGFDLILKESLNLNNKKIALIHIKLHIINATAAPSDPLSYELAIRWLIENDFQVVFVGREPFPPLFKNLGVINYSESACASYKHDVQLFSEASVVITAGSGVSWLSDCLGKPYLYLDSWHLANAMPSEYCISVPPLVKERATGKYITFLEQRNLYLHSSDFGGEKFPLKEYEARNASSDEVLSALKEVLILKKIPQSLTQDQEQFHRLLPVELQYLVKSRVSQYFINKHKNLLRV